MKEIKNFQKAYNELTKAFAKKYYGDEAYIENPLEEIDRFLHPINISDEWWSIENIWIAMNFDIEKEIVLSWFDFSYDQYKKHEKGEIDYMINFYTYIKTYERNSKK